MTRPTVPEAGPQPVERKHRWYQCPGCWSVLLRTTDKDWECDCGELMTNIDLRDQPAETIQAAVDRSGRPTMNPHPDNRGVWR
jgi:hypothetical protein